MGSGEALVDLKDYWMWGGDKEETWQSRMVNPPCGIGGKNMGFEMRWL